jgi:hypothetical protein
MELNLENPIFLVYISVGEMSRLGAEQAIAKLKNNLTFDNATTWIMPVKSETKV